MTRTLLASLSALALLAACNTGTGPSMNTPMAKGQDRTFSVPTFGADTSRAHAAATNECRRYALFPKLLATEPGRLVFECVSERPAADRP